MKRRQRIFFVVIIVAAVVSGCVQPVTPPTTEPTTVPTEAQTLPPGVEPISLEGLDCLVEVYTMFQSDRMYYAIRESGVEQVDVEAVRLIAPEMIDFASLDSENEETSSWYVRLMYAPRVENFDSERYMYRDLCWLPTAFGENVRIYYSKSWDRTEKAESALEMVMLQTAYAFFTEDLEKYSAGNEAAWPLTSFLMTVNGDTILIEDQDGHLYRPMADGSLQLLIELPDSLTSVSYYWFPQN